jgi:hypothetical protein
MSDLSLLTMVRYLLGIGTSSGGNDLGAVLPELARRIAISGITIDSSGRLTFATPATGFGDGTVTAPSITFASDLDTGVYGGAVLGGGNFIGIAAAGASIILISNTVLRLKSTQLLGWASGVPDQTNQDTTLERVAAGKLQLSGTTPMLLLGGATTSFPALKRNAAAVSIRLADDSADADLQARSVIPTAVTFANRPGTPVEGMIVSFTDSTTVVWGATITGGGANHVLGYYNGTNWTVIGK